MVSRGTGEGQASNEEAGTKRGWRHNDGERWNWTRIGGEPTAAPEHYTWLRVRVRRGSGAGLSANLVTTAGGVNRRWESTRWR